MNLPIDFEDRMQEMLRQDYPAFKKALQNTAYSGVRIVKKEAEQHVRSLLGEVEGVPWCRKGFYADKTSISGKHPYHMAGLVYFQEPSAMAPVCALPIEPDDYVLDLCAAPGGKSTQAAQKLGENGLLVANEVVRKRAEVLVENLERCGVSNGVVTNETPQRLSQKYTEFFDKIIVDAPCSGEGMFRKEPQAVSEWSVAHTKSCALRQQHIVDCAVQMLRPGGHMVYSTCTFAPVENEGIAAYILSHYPNMSLVPISLDGLSDGCTRWSGSDMDMTGTKRIFPHLAKGEGHFAALFKKVGEKPKRAGFGKNTPPPELYCEFEKNAFKTKRVGNFQLFGEHLYLLPQGIDTDGIKFLRAGLYIGVCKKGRFEPSHALLAASRVEDFRQTLNFSWDSEVLQAYLRGETIACDSSGWTAVLVDGFPIGWGKGSGGILKNHFPKHFRLR